VDRLPLVGGVRLIGHGDSLPADTVGGVAEAPFTRDPTYRPIVGVARGVFAGLGIRFDIVGEQNIPLTGGALLAMNHTSFLDFALGGKPADLRGKRLVRFMAKDSVFSHPVAGPLMRGMRHIPVDREHGSQSFRDAVRYLKAGELVGIFPEATMSRAMDVKDIKTGAVRIAIAADVPLIPMCILGGARILSYGHRDLSRGVTVAITVGEAMHPKRGEDTDALTEQLRSRMRELLDETVARYPYEGSPWWIPARLGGSAPTLEEAEVLDEEARAAKAAKRAAKAAKKGGGT
jgi:1-acyl-sn-glycerol-3-phosphate acyltransferase